MVSRISLVLLLFTLPFTASCEGLRATLIGWFSPEYAPEGKITDLKPEFSGPDANRKQKG